MESRPLPPVVIVWRNFRDVLFDSFSFLMLPLGFFFSFVFSFEPLVVITSSASFFTGFTTVESARSKEE